VEDIWYQDTKSFSSFVERGLIRACFWKAIKLQLLYKTVEKKFTQQVEYTLSHLLILQYTVSLFLAKAFCKILPVEYYDSKIKTLYRECSF